MVSDHKKNESEIKPRMNVSDFVELLCDFLDSDTHTYQVAEPRTAFADCIMDEMEEEDDFVLTPQEWHNLDTAARAVRTCLADFPMKWRRASGDE